ncbi:MAG: hypothetical protein ACPLPR_05410 [Bacillota bacterium]
MDRKRAGRGYQGILRIARFLKSDSFQGGLLTALVVASLALSAVVWYGSSLPLARPSQDTVPAKFPRNPGDWRQLVTPARGVIHLSAREHYVVLPGNPVLADVWARGDLIGQMSGLLAGGHQEVRPESLAFEGPGVTLEFAMPINPEEYGLKVSGLRVEQLTLLGGKSPAALAKSYPGGTWVKLPLKELPQLVGAALGKFDPRSGLRAVELPARLNGTVVERGVFVPEEITMTEYAGEYDLQGNEALAAFFMDSAMLRRVMERDGALIFTDGQRGLRIYPSGEIEFTWPEAAEAQPGQDLRRTMEEAVNFVEAHGGLPAQARFKRVDLSHTEICYFVGGYPVLRPGASLTLDLSKYGVRRYFRAVRKASRVLNQRQFEVSAREAVSAGVGAVGKQVTVKYVYPCYLDTGTSLRPCWAVEFREGGVAVVDAFTGQVNLL